MHEKRFKIDFFANFRKLQKKLLVCKKRYAEILHVARTVVTIVLSVASKQHFSKQTLQGATAASFCRILDRDTALESSDAEL